MTRVVLVSTGGTIPTERIEPAVDLVTLVIGSDGRFTRCALQSGAKGLVVEAFGRGNADPAVIAALREAIATGLAVLIASRCRAGRVKPSYGDHGGQDVAESGAIFAGDLPGMEARVLLSVLLGAGFSREVIARDVAQVAG